jgi:tripartite-type tricarboxylate transporter receptor subunit TctC
MCSSPHVLAVHPSVAASTVKGFVALAKASPGHYSYASAGRGTPAHLAGELFKLAFELDMTHVPFSGGGPAITATLGGHTSSIVSALPTGAPYAKAGNVRALAMMSAKRASLLPDVPTMAEATGTELEADSRSSISSTARSPKSSRHRSSGSVCSRSASIRSRARPSISPNGSGRKSPSGARLFGTAISACNSGARCD